MNISLEALDDATLKGLAAVASQALRAVRLCGRAGIPLLAEIYESDDFEAGFDFALRPVRADYAGCDEVDDMTAPSEALFIEPGETDASNDGPVVAPVAMVPEEVPQSSGPIIPAVVPSPLKVEELLVAAEFSADMTAAAMHRWVRQIDPEGSRAFDDYRLVDALMQGFGIAHAADELGVTRQEAVARWREICPIVTLHTQQLLAKALYDRLGEARQSS